MDNVKDGIAPKISIVTHTKFPFDTCTNYIICVER